MKIPNIKTKMEKCLNGTWTKKETKRGYDVRIA